MELEQVTQIITDFVAKAHYVTAAGTISDGTWGLECNGVEILLTFHPEQQRLQLMAELGTPGADSRESTYATFLTANSLPGRTGGIRVLLDQPGGNLTQECDLPINQLSSAVLADRAQHFLEFTQRGRSIVADPAVN